MQSLIFACPRSQSEIVFACPGRVFFEENRKSRDTVSLIIQLYVILYDERNWLTNPRILVTPQQGGGHVSIDKDQDPTPHSDG